MFQACEVCQENAEKKQRERGNRGREGENGTLIATINHSCLSQRRKLPTQLGRRVEKISGKFQLKRGGKGRESDSYL